MKCDRQVIGSFEKKYRYILVWLLPDFGIPTRFRFSSWFFRRSWYFLTFKSNVFDNCSFDNVYTWDSYWTYYWDFLDFLWWFMDSWSLLQMPFSLGLYLGYISDFLFRLLEFLILVFHTKWALSRLTLIFSIFDYHGLCFMQYFAELIVK